MPTVSVFIRRDDLDKWKSLPNKSQAIHDMLAHTIVHYDEVGTVGDVEGVVVDDIKKATGLVMQSTPSFIPSPPDPELGYPCCQKNKPCKHWKFDDLNGQWVNELTGKVREAV